MNKFISLVKAKHFLVFTLTVILGLWFGGFFDRYVFSFGFSESFSETEAGNLIGKRVINTCQPKPDSERIGEIVSFSEADFGDIYVNVVWEEKSDKLYPTGFYKSSFKQCVKFINEN